MNSNDDPLVAAAGPDRVYYATGVLLAADDFAAEQAYHRGRLARALAYLHGSGTVAGLKVTYQPAVAATPAAPAGQEELLTVGAGLAIDRLGRLIEVPRALCIRLGRWYDAQAAGDLTAGLHGAPQNGVVADVFLRFLACERGKTPAFADGPFDALDAVVPARLRDSAEVGLIIRKEAAPPLPESHWPDLAGLADPQARRQALHAALLDAWPQDRADTPANPEPAGEYAPNADPTAVFLARVIIPAAAAPGAGAPPLRQAGPVTVDNESRLFVYATRALAHLAGG